MGRLFWKFFVAFLAALLIAGIGVGFTVSLLHQAGGPPDRGPPPSPWLGQGRPPPPPRFDEHRPPPPPPRGGLPPPLLMLIAAGAIGGLAASALLAWYFAQPVRRLRWALREIAEGRFDTRVAPRMGHRRDEVADLGRDVDAMAKKIGQMVAAQRRLLHDVSHELRSPLARLQAAVGLARQDPAKIEATFDRIDRETARLDRLVGELLTLSRLDAGTSGEATTSIDLVDLVAGIAEDAAFEARAAGRDLHFSGDGEFRVNGRAELLHRAVENVIRNAIKFTRPGTVVTVVLDRPAPDRLRITVCDQGPGVPVAELTTIFEPFHRGAGNASSDGFGLGLAIARRAVEAHGGSIRATNRIEGGLCVEILLPAR